MFATQPTTRAGDDCDPIGKAEVGTHIRSNRVPVASPPPQHMVTNDVERSLRSISCRALVSRILPVLPKACPAPPFDSPRRAQTVLLPGDKNFS